MLQSLRHPVLQKLAAKHTRRGNNTLPFCFLLSPAAYAKFMVLHSQILSPSPEKQDLPVDNWHFIILNNVGYVEVPYLLIYYRKIHCAREQTMQVCQNTLRDCTF